MRSYRVYRMNRSGRIRNGDWLPAADDQDARRQAEHLCDEETAKVEVWEGARPVEEIDCHPER
jgi:hypothetical protein